MNAVRIDRLRLQAAIQKNRDEHRDLFLTAQEGFRKRVVEELDDMLTEARDGRGLRTHVALVPPEDHTNEYNRILDMLAMSDEPTVEISQADFARYVRNEWDWFARASALNVAYASGGKVDRR